MGAQLRGRFEKYVWKIYLRKHRQAEYSRTVSRSCHNMSGLNSVILPAFAFTVVTAGCPTQTQTA